jgi:hypothetical protein
MVGRANHHDALVRTASMKLVATESESAMSSSEVWIKGLHPFQVPFAFGGFLMLVGLRFRPYETHRSTKWSLNLLPLSYISYSTRILTEPTPQNQFAYHD